MDQIHFVEANKGNTLLWIKYTWMKLPCCPTPSTTKAQVQATWPQQQEQLEEEEEEGVEEEEEEKEE